MQRTDLIFWHMPTNANVPFVMAAVVVDDSGIYRGLYSGETLEQLAGRYIDPKMCRIDEFAAMRENAIRTGPTPCSEKHFTAALKCLPPLDWQRVNGVESFKMTERLVGNMTNIYARKGGDYWSFVDRDDLSAAAIADKIINCAGTETNNECYRWSGRALYYAASSGLVQDLIEQHQNRSNDQEGGA